LADDPGSVILASHLSMMAELWPSFDSQLFVSDGPVLVDRTLAIS